ncbi:Glycosyl hydrolase family 115 [Alteromonadaceae bacterium Bs31]|nr:Glycosyl hydrolase family 115 [Alteromonadaceae bacterium Bs31]
MLRVNQGLFLFIFLFLAASSYALNEALVADKPLPGYHLLHANNRPAEIHWDDSDFEVVKIAARSLMEDFALVTGEKGLGKPSSILPSPSPMRIYIGSLSGSALIKKITKLNGIDLSHLEGRWESFEIRVINDPMASDKKSLLIVGSDRRGTAYGVYQLSQAIGISPWYWWADVQPEKTDAIYISEKTQQFGPPSVKYRGIFINDEDWGLQPWASNNHEKELGNIGPKTYERVFDLLLRLKANTLWPAMHKVSLAFNQLAENKTLADRYAIVMGSSHAEPMLRNNVSEWPHSKESYNYATQPQQVVDYWKQRVKENGAFENIYSLGMRGIHDSGMTGGGSNKEKVALLEKIFEDQRKLLRAHVKPEVAEIPQVFTPYKEVLALYRDGLQVPEDVSLIWPDDNHGFIRQLPNAQERSRKGGSGVYYHLSYLGSPLAYLWLYSTPPALVWQEMNKAYRMGARQLWVANVGDIKPAELGIELFLQMAWDIDRWTLQNQHLFLSDWATREFPQAGASIGELLRKYFALNFQRKPEHLQWWLPHTRSKGSDLSASEIESRLAAYKKLEHGVREAKKMLTAEQHAAFFQLVEYPIRASATANRRYFHAEQYARWFHADLAIAKAHGQLAVKADSEQQELSKMYNEDISNGKWRGIMSAEPADNLWRSFRQSPLALPSEHLLEGAAQLEKMAFKGKNSPVPEVYLEAEAYVKSRAYGNSRWQVVRDLGRVGDAIAVYPLAEARSGNINALMNESPYVEYLIQIPEEGKYKLYFSLLPTFPLNTDALRIAYSLPGLSHERKLLSLKRQVGDESWKRAVLSASVRVSSEPQLLEAGKHTLRVYGIDAGVILDHIALSRSELTNSFLVPL